MRLDFDKSVPEHEQRARVADAKSIKQGRKHMHKAANWRAKALAKGKAITAHNQRLAHKFKTAVAAYWRGERENYPEEP